MHSLSKTFALHLMPLGKAAKLILLSFDSTLRSNLSVGLPIDLLVYNANSLKLERTRRIERDNDYFQKLSREWSRSLRKGGFILKLVS